MLLEIKLNIQAGRAGEPDIFLVAPAPDFFSEQLRLLIFPQEAPATGILFQAAAAPAPDFF